MQHIKAFPNFAISLLYQFGGYFSQTLPALRRTIVRHLVHLGFTSRGSPSLLQAFLSLL